MNRRGFTLLELLIVIAILAVLATVAVLVINPAEYLRQSRDTKRIADIAALNKALAMAEFNDLNMGGASTTVFVSLVDTVSTCANLGLPPLPTGYTYNCVTTSSDLRKTNGTGWIPVNLGGIIEGAPLSVLPTDPINNTNNFYAYIPGGSFALSATLESNKYLKQSALTDGGTNPGKIEMGSDLKLLARADGLVGYWSLDEGSGTVARDGSGKGNNGNGAMIGWASTGCVMGGCVNASSANAAISIASNSSLDLHSNFTISNWVKINVAIQASSWPYSLGGDSHTAYSFRSTSNGVRWAFEYGTDYPTCSGTAYAQMNSTALGTDTWHLLTATYDGTTIKTYVDGALFQERSFATGMCTKFPLYIASAPVAPGSYTVDEARIYSRVIGASEIKAMYDATK